MGKKQHSKDRMYLTSTEWATEWGGARRRFAPRSNASPSIAARLLLRRLRLRCAPQIVAAGNTFGTHFRVTTYGESHGGDVGCIIDGCPPRLALSESDLQVDLDRRRPGQSRITTPRKETDTCRISSGVYEGMTTGTPIKVSVPNTDQRGKNYSEMSSAYRPSHADATYDMKYGIRSVQGGGRSSPREPIGRVAAGAVAKKILKLYPTGTEVLAQCFRYNAYCSLYQEVWKTSGYWSSIEASF